MVRSERESTNEIARFGRFRLRIPAISSASESEKQTPAQSLSGLFTDDDLEATVLSHPFFPTCQNFEPCIPSPGTKVPDSKNWIHEIKHDGYRLIVQREKQLVENTQFLVVFKSSSAALTPRFALSVRAVGCGFHSETSFSAFSSSGLDNMVAIAFTLFLGATFESLKYAYAKDKSFGAPFPRKYEPDKL